MKHERRVVGHVSGHQEQMDTCVCGKPWPCADSTSSKYEVLVREFVAHYEGNWAAQLGNGFARRWLERAKKVLEEQPDETSGSP